MPVSRRFEGRTVCLIATGPSLRLEQIASARSQGFVLFGCNNVWEIVPDLAVLYACNTTWWAYYWSDRLLEYPAEKWTTSQEAAKKYRLNWIAERDRFGLSSDPTRIHHGHGSGYSLLNLAYLMGAQRIVLLGYDMRYAADYSGEEKQVGSGPRHYFGEYPSALLHWPKVSVANGVHAGLIKYYERVAEQNTVEIVNCTPGSALTCFPMKDIDAL